MRTVFLLLATLAAVAAGFWMILSDDVPAATYLAVIACYFRIAAADERP